MRGADEMSGSLFSYIDLEARIPARHPLRKIRQVVNAALASLDAAFAALGDNSDTKTAVERILRDKGATRDDAKDHVARLLESGRWTEWRDARKNAPTYVGTPAAIERRRTEAQTRKMQDAAG